MSFVIVKLETKSASEVSMRLCREVRLGLLESHETPVLRNADALQHGGVVHSHVKVSICHFLMITQHQHQLIETMQCQLKCQKEITIISVVLLAFAIYCIGSSIRPYFWGSITSHIEGAVFYK